MPILPRLLSLLACLPLVANAEPSKNWHPLAPIPDPIGFAAPFAGTNQDVLIVAGGANFPHQPPWQGGTKIWHDCAFVLETLSGSWRDAGHLPRPLAYGVSISTDRGILCIGGSDADQHHSDVFLLQWNATEKQLTSHPMPSLPTPCANACGTIINGTVYLAGGQTSPTSTSALHTFWSLDLNAPNATWQVLPPWPGPARILATAATLEGAFYLFGGADLSADSNGKPQRTWLRDAYRFQPNHGWQKLADLPRPSVAAPSPAITTSPTTILIAGGDDGSQLHTPPTEHLGFPNTPLLYNVSKNQWQIGAPMPFSLVTTSIVTWQHHHIIPGGEAKPGIRSTQVWASPISNQTSP